MTACMQGFKTMEKAPYLFSVTNGVNPGCVLGPTLFSIMFSAMLFGVFNGLDNGIDIQYHTCLQPQKASSKDQGEDWYCQRASVHRWLCYYQSQHAKQC